MRLTRATLLAFCLLAALVCGCGDVRPSADAGRARSPPPTACARPLLWTTNLMAPEAYVLSAAVEGWVAGETGEEVRERAARAYDTYQRCGLKAARNLFASGF